MFPNILAAEWIKLRTTKAFWWTTAIFFLVCLGVPALYVFSALKFEGQDSVILLPQMLVAPVGVFGFLILMIQAVMVVTGEYRHSITHSTFQACPNRTLVVIAKLVLYTLIAGILTFLAVLGSLYVAKLVANEASAATLDIWGGEVSRRMMWAYPLAAVLLVVFTHAIAWIVRQTAGAISILFLWYFAVEGLINMLVPKIGKTIYKYAPFNNFNAFVNNQATEAPWGVTGSIWYFAAWALGLLVIGVLLVNSRDA
ncbi:multidrug ABC transporter permease [Corynebacterium pygosceleis]|uniref:Multidrug ABC transporter permease n=1 Tax=Corynebacterium pygosceleis TaxID=2800406 RepID=A0A9Q4CBN6_9CORY|nr:multidrug ABC transporter permease [Corynebacterium pygosceleis]MCK7638372.1 multidrug ABC transporter permease [Corynebacterium pygosceleis]MCK7675352.1 multidrug ABC transporter permease [Corynebacterium pygosceleis]MCL0121254.1 multidrug ABC transporter permease [Corynebacterium pygosceleis]MCX7445469.1 multidrug ABC transporter permease [Corynebacterium pygosceleis]MCX7469035.1 multidrug ABC transporter permease [Corynebacterium pygosceleis]